MARTRRTQVTASPEPARPGQKGAAGPASPRAGHKAAARAGQLQSLHRALDLLEALASRRGGATLTSLREALGLPPSTVHRLLATLAGRGYVSQDPDTGWYRVGVRTFEAGNGFLVQNQLRDVARPVMRRLVGQVNESVNLAVLDDQEAVYVEMAEANHTLRTFARIGGRVPLHCTGVGKALLMGLSAQEARHIARRRGLTAYTPTTITRIEDLLAEMKRAAEMGCVFDREEYEVGVRCAAAPVWDHSGRVVAALSISGPTSRISEQHLPALAALVRPAAAEVSRALGHSPAPREPRSGARG